VIASGAVPPGSPIGPLAEVWTEPAVKVLVREPHLAHRAAADHRLPDPPRGEKGDRAADGVVVERGAHHAVAGAEKAVERGVQRVGGVGEEGDAPGIAVGADEPRQRRPAAEGDAARLERQVMARPPRRRADLAQVTHDRIRHRVRADGGGRRVVEVDAVHAAEGVAGGHRREIQAVFRIGCTGG